MVAKEIGMECSVFGPLRELGRHAGDVEFADQPVLDSTHGLALAQMRMRHRLIQCQYWSAGNSLDFESFKSGFARRELAEPLLNNVFQRLVIVSPRARRAETRI